MMPSTAPSAADHPAFVHCGAYAPLAGFSGAKIGLLMPDGGARRVRKAAASPADSEALSRQAQRQRELSWRLAGVANVPEILCEGTAEGCYWFDMEYVVGTDAVRYLRLGSLDRVERLLGQILEVLKANSETAVGGEVAIHLGSRIAGKLDEIDTRTLARHRTSTDLIRARIETLDIELTPNFAHGDLTLENILVDRRQRIWLIDSIPSPFNHYWLDLAKLFQDIEGRWFERRGRSLSLGLTWVLRERLMENALMLDSRYYAVHSVLLALTFARILPYCVTDSDTRFVESKISSALDSTITN